MNFDDAFMSISNIIVYITAYTESDLLQDITRTRIKAIILVSLLFFEELGSFLGLEYLLCGIEKKNKTGIKKLE